MSSVTNRSSYGYDLLWLVGGVFVDGVDLREVDPTWLRQQFGVVSQVWHLS